MTPTSGGDSRLKFDCCASKTAGKVYFLGKSTSVPPASPTAPFLSKHRFLTEDCVLLVHERRMDKELKLSGALLASTAALKDALAKIMNGQELERDRFNELVEGAHLTF